MNGTDRNWTGILAATTHTTLPTWVTMVLMVSMIFGGCCSNVRYPSFQRTCIADEDNRYSPLKRLSSKFGLLRKGKSAD